MRKFAIILASVSLLFAALPVSESFTGADSTPLPTYNANWVDATGSFVIDSNSARPATALVYNTDGWTGDTFSNDQYSETTLFTITTNTYVGAAVRVNTANTDAYVCITDGANITLQQVLGTGSAQTISSSAASIVSGDVIRLEVSGTSLTCKVNGVTTLSGSDSDLTGGRAGISSFCIGACGVSLINSWTADNLSAASTRRKSIFFQ